MKEWEKTLEQSCKFGGSSEEVGGWARDFIEDEVIDKIFADMQAMGMDITVLRQKY